MSKRNKTLNSFFQVRTTEAAETGPSAQTTDVGSMAAPNVRAELKPGDVKSDPVKRIPIEELDPDIRDLARREYISMGPCQPTNHTYEKINGRSFHNYWFNDHRGWNIALKKDQPFAFIVFCLSNQELKTMVLKHSREMDSNLGRMDLKFLISMLASMIVLIINLGNIMRISKIKDKICHMCLIGVLRSKKKNTKPVS